jgi:hypothetical protein
MELISDNLSIYQIAIDIGVPAIFLIFLNWLRKKLLLPYKEIQVLLNQINAYHTNIYGWLYSMKNQILRVSFMNKKSLSPNKKNACSYINLSRNADGTYCIFRDYGMPDMNVFSIDQLMKEFT